MSTLSRFSALLSELIKSDSIFLAADLMEEDGSLKLREDEVGLPPRTVKLKNVPRDAKIIKVDHFDLQGRFIHTGNNSLLGKRCDYLIVDAQHSRILLIELKLGDKSAGDRKQVVAQLKGGRAIVDYLVALLTHFHNEELYLDPKEFRYAWITYRENTALKTVSRATRWDIESPMQMKNGRKQTYDYSRMVR